MSYDEHRATPSANYPTPAPPSPTPVGCWPALVTLGQIVAVLLGVVMYWRDRDPAWLAVAIAALGAR